MRVDAAKKVYFAVSELKSMLNLQSMGKHRLIFLCKMNSLSTDVGH